MGYGTRGYHVVHLRVPSGSINNKEFIRSCFLTPCILLRGRVLLKFTEKHWKTLKSSGRNPAVLQPFLRILWFSMNFRVFHDFRVFWSSNGQKQSGLTTLTGLRPVSEMMTLFGPFLTEVQLVVNGAGVPTGIVFERCSHKRCHKRCHKVSVSSKPRPNQT